MSTLIEELESAAAQINCRCRDFGTPCRRELEAAALRKRVERIKEYQSEHPHADETCPYCVAVRWLTGDLTATT